MITFVSAINLIVKRTLHHVHAHAQAQRYSLTSCLAQFQSKGTGELVQHKAAMVEKEAIGLYEIIGAQCMNVTINDRDLLTVACEPIDRCHYFVFV